MNPSSTQRVIVITGAAGALGAAVCEALAAPGVALVRIDRTVPVGRDEDVCLAADVTDAAAMAEAAAAVARRFACVNALVHVAGGFEMGEPVHGLSRDMWDRLMDLNAWSFVNVATHFAPLLRAAGGGRVVAVSAAAAARGDALKGAYSASKAALQRLVESLDAELADEGIAVNSLAPSVLDTPANRAAMPGADTRAWTPLAEAAEAVRFLLGDGGTALHGRHLVLGR
ncbi:SDR family NAD(P)-dependent oxidoreductase [Rhizobacter sp. LjRoot28]|uniref:SDR family NAD(P)-dependent oxidoreductase n=1 Tax=Rhizobacter sp. LjRoot28 TaxID=3342309 RepID=UPI003ED116BB